MIDTLAIPRDNDKTVIPVNRHSAKAVAFPVEETESRRILRMQECAAILECRLENATKERIIQRFVFLAAIYPCNTFILESDIGHS